MSSSTTTALSRQPLTPGSQEHGRSQGPAGRTLRPAHDPVPGCDGGSGDPDRVGGDERYACWCAIYDLPAPRTVTAGLMGRGVVPVIGIRKGAVMEIVELPTGLGSKLRAVEGLVRG